MSDESQERWRPVREFAGLYEVSNFGRVRSVARVVAIGDGERLSEGRILRQSGVRYKHVSLYNRDAEQTFTVHRLVANAFVPGTGSVVRHLDGNSLNNVASNLAWGSQKDNEADKARHGRVLRGPAHPRAILTAEHVISIREMHSNGFSQLEIARATGIGRCTVGNVVRRKCYTDVR